MSTGWSWYVIALVVLNLGGCTWLLWWTAKRRPGDPKPEDTSHYWDGDITEYNKPMPRWWIIGFYIALAFGVVYLAWYGGLGGYPGLSRWSSAGEHDRAKATADARLEETFSAYRGRALPDLAGDPRARALGRSIFANTCATCHGSSGQGAIGYPDLTDAIWHWGGAPERILETVLDGREGVMPEWGTVLAGMGGPEAVDYTIAYVRTLSAPETLQNNYMAAQGRKLYEGVCVACHGVDGTGNPDIGAPDLTDDYWMYGSSRESLRKTIAEGRHGVMPAHRDLLGETRARLVAAYVWSLSNGAAAAD
ncbi:cytochrome-c oxidase, cbb3-type subunit III [Pseudoxanthomonas broegbernensis]|uniref:Cbb3-type cytochrome c oxidase subunit n=1 Tax=Pseudoxanthomonas broegbernensis TaxID=83619 RepID=A0A7V8GNH7_9GAMM|nr:cytochrome-c oxidase, cbb3-type subunit III [Pseudoxanthomonas broegbernensis]KAF1687128.1 cytochrome-c oxidase, cbb3-type subunit III [Pseudoxanthomonas broegbernensis]MBB6065896.1 cytochrome c oxidase cbb3-type subunit 3 [Pseudoxanthomonas broegbernensis]